MTDDYVQYLKNEIKFSDAASPYIKVEQSVVLRHDVEEIDGKGALRIYIPE